MSRRLVALDAGTYYHRTALSDPTVAQHLAATVYLPELDAAQLASADALIVTCRTPPGRLKQKLPLLEEFVARGGTLVIMGETDPHLWWPHHAFTPMAIDFTWWLEPGGDSGLRFPDHQHPLFRHVPAAHCHWHYHGGFAADSAARTIIDCKQGLAVLIDDAHTLAPGRVVATGLDPFYHHGAGFMPNATRFLHGFLSWLRSD